MLIKSKSGKTSVLEACCGCVCAWEGGWGGELGVDGDWLPLSTRPQRYCDPAKVPVLLTTGAGFLLPVSPKAIFNVLLYLKRNATNKFRKATKSITLSLVSVSISVLSYNNKVFFPLEKFALETGK